MYENRDAGRCNGSRPALTSVWRCTSHITVTGAAAFMAILTACGVPASSPGDLGELQRIASMCGARPPAAMVQIDESGSSRSGGIRAERLRALESIVRETAVCRGRLRVAVFSSSSAATATLFDGELQPYGATRNARLRRVPKLVNKTMSQIRSSYASAVAALPGGGSDIIAQFGMAREWIGQLGAGYRLQLIIFTDGFDTVGRRLGNAPLSKAKAVALAQQTPVPDLSGASVTVAGLGRVTGRPPTSAVVEGLVAFYNALCARTRAAACTSVTDYEAGR